MEYGWTKNLRKITPYVPGEQPKTEGLIKLNANENPYPPSPKAIEVIQDCAAGRLNLYPDANAMRLREALANYHSLQPDQVFVGNGSDEVLALAFIACFNSKKPILFPDITYTFYNVWCDLFHIPYETIPLTEDFRICAEDYKRDNGGVVLPNPNAPTGIGEGQAFIESVLRSNRDCVVIIDEAYVDFGAYSCIKLLEEYENLLVVHTFSKSRSLAGLRIGCAFGSKRLIDTLRAVKNSYNSYTLDTLAIAAGAASIEDEEYFRETLGRIQATRERTFAALIEMGFEVFPSQTNFLLATHPKVKAKTLFDALRKENIYIRYFNIPRINNHLRITVGREEDMDILLRALRKHLE
jgi:histidinol-phosphate aminotransferase